MAKQTEPTTGIRARGVVDVKMLELLVCPLTSGPLKFDPDRDELVSERGKLAYPVRDGIPIMLVSEARELPDND
ncbi:hypothetical protein SAMN05877838_1794 [Hoeflea halophila]|uniref:UPF0434 protein SAMN05877838_1794 n=1 Tax=Hoeflea halophila TaxID=714899 RepID=A0A286IC10_9HYPH|nr:Trm112 family protein [Hoeflea halophila]SOE16909.1 hypothetical protein SAMN05877838_1794 [Hoeflea halophila]